MKFTTTLLAASAAAIALTTGTEARLRGSHGRQLDFYGGSKAPSPLYGRTGNNPLSYDEDDSLGDCGEDWYTHSGSRGCRSLFVKNDGSYDDEDESLGSIYGGSKTAYSYGGTNYNSGGYKADPTRSAMDAARRAGALTNTEAQRMGYSSNFRDEDDSLGDCNDGDWYMHSGSRGCSSQFVKYDGSYDYRR
jgi:hypothetical protein